MVHSERVGWTGSFEVSVDCGAEEHSNALGFAGTLLQALAFDLDEGSHDALFSLLAGPLPT